MQRLLWIISTVWLALPGYGQRILEPPPSPVLPIATGTLADTTLVIELLDYAWTHKSNYPDTAKVYTERALELARRIDYLAGQGDALHTAGMIYWYQGRYDLATENFFAALQIREKTGDKLGLGRSYNNVGLVFFDQGEYDRAYEYFVQSRRLRESLQDTAGLVFTFNNIADIYRVRGDSTAALSTYRHALALARAIDLTSGEAFVLHNLGTLYRDRGDLELANANFVAALRVARDSRNFQQQTATLNALADLMLDYDRVDDLDTIVAIVQQSLNLADNILSGEDKMTSINILAQIAARKGDYAEAYLQQQRYLQLYEEYKNMATQRAIYEIQAQYETQLKDQELLKKEQELNSLNRALLSTLVFVALLVAAGGIFLFRLERKSRRVAERQKQEIEQQNKLLQRSNYTLEQFAYVASHDLKEPLRNIGSFSGLLERRFGDQLGQTGREYIDFIVDNVRQMYVLLEDVLAYSRLENMQQDELKHVDLNEVIQFVRSSMQTQLEERNGQLVTDTLPPVLANRTQMRQLFMNIVSNGLKFNDSEVPRVTITASREADKIHCRISDNGIGIEPAYSEKIFQVFQRLNRQEYPGTGIGLAICARIVEQLNGQIWVENNEQGGTTFHFTLPATASVTKQYTSAKSSRTIEVAK